MDISYRISSYREILGTDPCSTPRHQPWYWMGMVRGTNCTPEMSEANKCYYRCTDTSWPKRVEQLVLTSTQLYRSNSSDEISSERRRRLNQQCDLLRSHGSTATPQIALCGPGSARCAWDPWVFCKCTRNHAGTRFDLAERTTNSDIGGLNIILPFAHESMVPLERNSSMLLVTKRA